MDSCGTCHLALSTLEFRQNMGSSPLKEWRLMDACTFSCYSLHLVFTMETICGAKSWLNLGGKIVGKNYRTCSPDVNHPNLILVKFVFVYCIRVWESSHHVWSSFTLSWNCYRPRSEGNVFTREYLFTVGRGVCLGVDGGVHSPLPQDGYCRGWYASYWNAYSCLCVFG